MTDTRTINDFRFGLEWSPKLAEMMLRFPWPDSAFVAGDPTKVCRVCGGGAASAKHDNTHVDSNHAFEPSEPFSEEKIASARDEWRRRMANLPTPEAEKAWDVIHGEKLDRLHALFTKCGIFRREDIELLGCTGCIEHGLSFDDIKFLRIGLAGSGVGLPCFVPPDRYCLAHETSGGLQSGQDQHYGHMVESVARALTPAEQAHAKLVQAARKSEREHGAHSLLHGHTLPAGWQEMDGADGGAQVETFQEAVEGLREEGGIDDVVAAGRMIDNENPRDPWMCDVHDTIDWTCRHCLAEAIVDGDLTPVIRIAGPMGVGEVQASDVEAKLVEMNKIGSIDHVEIFVQAAKFTRKLARD